MVKIQGNQSSLLRELPQREREFAQELGLHAIRSSEGTTLESLLKAVANVSLKREYGWEEAILDRMWYRFPSQVRDQMFCSENALRTYIILQSLGIRANYGVAENYQERGMAHEIVTVPENDTLFVIDWTSVIKGKMHGDRIQMQGDRNEIRVLEIEGTDVVTRAKEFQTGKYVIESIECGQHLYRRRTRTGEVEAYVKYHRESEELEFTHIFHPGVGAPPFFSRQTYTITPSGVKPTEQQGVVIAGRGFNIKTQTYFQKRDAIKVLSDDDERNLKLYVLYHVITEEQTRFLIPKKDREQKLSHFRNEAAQNPNDPIAQVLGTYASLYDYITTSVGEECAERFLDFEIVKLGASLDFPRMRDIDDLLYKKTRIRDNKTLQVIHMSICAKLMSEKMSEASALECQRILCQELATRTENPYYNDAYSLVLGLVTQFQKMERYG